MMVFGFATLGVAAWTTWAAVAAGSLVTSLIVGSAIVYSRWRQRLNYASREEDLPWEKLLVLIEQRNRERAAAGLPPQEATDEELDQLLARLPGLPDPRPVELPEDREFQLRAGSERRAGRRRWGNPTEVRMSSDCAEQVHGLVVNRSTGGLGIYADKEIAAGTFITIRAIEAPPYVPSVLAEIRHCLKVGKGYLLGCKFGNEIPWTVRVWFG